jgi:hypothetical protein
VTVDLDSLFDPKDQPREDGDALGALVAAVHKKQPPTAVRTSDAAHDVLHHVGIVCDGVAVLSDLLDAGHSRAVIAALLTQGKDARVKPKLAMDEVAGVLVLWCRSSAWVALGQPNRREAPPSKSTLRHRLSAHNFERAMMARVEPVARERGVLLTVVRGLALREYVDQRKGDAWTVIKGTGGAQDKEEAGRVANGVFPDAIVAENWPLEMTADVRRAMWPTTGDETAHVAPCQADWSVALEVELHGKSSALLDEKVLRHDQSMKLKWWSATCWITDDADTQTRLLRAGIGTAAHPGHYLLGAADAHIGENPPPPGPGLAVPPPPWWAGPLRG